MSAVTLGRSLLLALAAGVVGVVIGRATAPNMPQSAPTLASYAPSNAPQAVSECSKAEGELKTKLAICMAYARNPHAESAAPAQDEEDPEERERKNREVLRTHTEVVIVRRADHSVSIYPPDEPIPDGIIVARRLPSGEIGWYAGPDAGPRSDPAAFWPAEPGSPLNPVVERAPSGTIMVNGKPGAPVVQWMFGGKDPPDAGD
jgi:hypothetical protein